MSPQGERSQDGEPVDEQGQDVDGTHQGCLVCGRPLQPAPNGGHKKKFCSDQHRAKWNRDSKRRAAAPADIPPVPLVLERFEQHLADLVEVAPQLRQLMLEYQPDRVSAELEMLRREVKELRGELTRVTEQRDSARQVAAIARTALEALQGGRPASAPDASTGF